MPTCTEVLHDGEEVFEDFVLKCARSMGYAFRPENQPADPSLWQEQISDDYQRRLTEAWTALIEVEGWDFATATKVAQAAYEQEQADYEQAKAQHQARFDRYHEMLSRVRLWTPPSEDHEPLKDFMVKELEDAIRFEQGVELKPPLRRNGHAYKQERLEAARADVDHAAQQARSARDHVKKRYGWLITLYEALGREIPTGGDHE